VTYFLNKSKASPLLLTFNLIYIKNLFNLFLSLLNLLINSILISWYPCRFNYSFKAAWFSVNYIIIFLYYLADYSLALSILILLYIPKGLEVVTIPNGVKAYNTAFHNIMLAKYHNHGSEYVIRPCSIKL
jgi:hypothetical protein